MSVVPLIHPSVPGRWNMSSALHLTCKFERPLYYTPTPVENTPSNNACKTIEMRGYKVASFNLGGDQYICLPQAFEYFLKHLVGGLHTVYTKLKRLRITPVVCNVEQVRILRGLGAIQPGVNRCKLITKKDFDALYQDCTNASRPGRPPKRYPLMVHSSEMDQHQRCQSKFALDQSHSTSPPKKMRLSTDEEADRTTNDCGLNMNEIFHHSLSAMSPDLFTNQNQQLAYLQQTMSQQFQNALALSRLQNGFDSSHPAVTQLLMMSHPAFFSQAASPSALAAINHFNNQIAQTKQINNQTLTSPKTPPRDNENSVHAERNERKIDEVTCSERYEADINHVSSSENERGVQLNNEKSNQTCSSPRLDLSSYKLLSGSRHSSYSKDVKTSSIPQVDSSTGSDCFPEVGAIKEESHKPSTMQILLKQIQELLKVAACSASLQEKKFLGEMEQIKEMLMRETRSREEVERRLLHCKEEKVKTEKLLWEEKEERQKLDSVMRKLLEGQSVTSGRDECMTSYRDVSGFSKGHDTQSDSSSPSLHTSVVTSSSDVIDLSTTGSVSTTPSSSRQSTPTNTNQNNNLSDGQSSPDLIKQDLIKQYPRLLLSASHPLQTTALQ